MAVQVLQIDIANSVAPLTIAKEYTSQRILVRFEGTPMGWITLNETENSSLSSEQLKKAIASQLSWQVAKLSFAKAAGLTRRGAVSNQGISVIVCTRNRTQNLAACLKQLLLLKYAVFEIIIVDNAPENRDTELLAKEFPVRYVKEERPGLDWARNRGIEEAVYSIVAITDDDALVDPLWLQAIAKNFEREDVMVVTGYVAPFKLDTAAQRIFELGCGGMGHGFQRRFIRKETLTSKQLLWASNFGVGANMAFRRTVFEIAGLFDVALDVGTPSNGGGDIEMFHRLVASGFLLVYDPAVLVWHNHRSSMNKLREQMANNGKGFSCYLMTCFQKRTVSRMTILKFFFADILFRWELKNILRPGGVPRSLTLMELKGILGSPLAYWLSQRKAKKMIRANFQDKPQKAGIFKTRQIV